MSFTTAFKSNMTDAELLSVAASEIAILRGRVASQQIKEAAYGPVTRFFLKYFSKF